MNSSSTVKVEMDTELVSAFKLRDAKILIECDPDFINSRANKYSIRHLIDSKDFNRLNNSIIARFLMLKPNDIVDLEKSIFVKMKEKLTEEDEN